MPNDDWEEIIPSSGWFSPFTRCRPGGGGATWLSTRSGRCSDPPLCLFQSNGFKFPWNWDDHETSRKDVNYFVYSIHYIHGGPESIPGPPWFPRTVLYLFLFPMDKLLSFQRYLRIRPPRSSAQHLAQTIRYFLWRNQEILKIFPGSDGEWNILGGGFKHFLFSPLPMGDDPIWLIFFKGVETTK